MALLSKKGSTFKAVGFWLEHIDPTSWETPGSYAMNISELESKTGLDFFCNLSDDMEHELETVSKTKMLSDWNLQ
jgi:endonuclease G